MRRWFCDGCREFEFENYSVAWNARLIVDIKPDYTGTRKMFFCEKCSKKLFRAIRDIFPEISKKNRG